MARPHNYGCGREGGASKLYPHPKSSKSPAMTRRSTILDVPPELTTCAATARNPVPVAFGNDFDEVVHLPLGAELQDNGKRNSINLSCERVCQKALLFTLPSFWTGRPVESGTCASTCD